MNTRVYATIRWLQRSGSFPLLVTIIDKALPLSEVNEAYRLIEEREIFGKVVLKA